MTQRRLKIGTRDSKLAMWQAKTVQNQLSALQIPSVIVPIKSKGDLNRTSPLHELGTVGIFTKVLDDALLREEVDLAVHSLKDVPTIPEAGLFQAALLKRDNPNDLFIGSKSPSEIIDEKAESIIATGSIRRKAQWLSRFPNHQIVGIRGNVPTRISKVTEEEIDGTILSAAGVERLGLSPKNSTELDWMIPAPAQGVVGVFCRENDQELISLLQKINHPSTHVTSHVERQVLNVLEGGCSAPIGVIAHLNNEKIKVKAGLFNTNGKKFLIEEMEDSIKNYADLGKRLAQFMLKNGGNEIIKEISGEK